MAGEPIRDQKLVKADSGFMAAILPPGMRAVSTEIAPETGAGGFILPNDRVDVLLTQHLKDPDPRGNQQDIVQTKIVLRKIGKGVSILPGDSVAIQSSAGGYLEVDAGNSNLRATAKRYDATGVFKLIPQD